MKLDVQNSGSSVKAGRRFVASLCIALLTLPVLAVIAPAAQAQTGATYFVIYGESGDYISQGDDIVHEESADISFTPRVNFDNGISVMIDVRDNGTFVERWTTDFAAPNEVPLVEGDSFTATRFPFQAADSAGLSISGAGRGCNNLDGEFAIRELTVESSVVTSFAADFRQSCDGGAPAVGGVRINSTIPVTDPGLPVDPPPPVDTTPPVAEANLIQTGRIKGTSSNFFVSAVCTDENPGVDLTSAEINGVAVDQGQKVRLVLSNRERVTNRKGKLTIQSSSITLTVECTDAVGNVSVATVMPSYES